MNDIQRTGMVNGLPRWTEQLRIIWYTKQEETGCNKCTMASIVWLTIERQRNERSQPAVNYRLFGTSETHRN